MFKTFSDLCSVSNSKENITIDYIPYSAMDLETTNYAKGKFSCSNRNCNHQNCPLYDRAPTNF